MSDGSAGKEKPLNDRGLATRLKPYGIRSRLLFGIRDLHRKGYMVEDFFDAWARSCFLPQMSGTSGTSGTFLIIKTILSRMSRMSRRGWREEQEDGLPDVPPFPVRRK